MSMSPLQTLMARDSTLGRVLPEVPPPPLASSHDVFLDLVSCIVDQQIHYRSRGVYLKKLLTLLDEDLPTATNLSRIDEEHFVAMKISRQKYHALKNLATHWTQHQLQSLDWEAQSDEAVRQALLAIKGIGPWTVDMILLYTLGRPDVFPVGDYHLKKIMIDLYDLSPGKGLAAEMTNIAEEWAPYRSLAVLSLFAWQASQPSTASS